MKLGTSGLVEVQGEGIMSGISAEGNVVICNSARVISWGYRSAILGKNVSVGDNAVVNAKSGFVALYGTDVVTINGNAEVNCSMASSAHLTTTVALTARESVTIGGNTKVKTAGGSFGIFLDDAILITGNANVCISECRDGVARAAKAASEHI